VMTAATTNLSVCRAGIANHEAIVRVQQQIKAAIKAGVESGAIGRASSSAVDKKA
jgi:hypothetical protein